MLGLKSYLHLFVVELLLSTNINTRNMYKKKIVTKNCYLNVKMSLIVYNNNNI